MEEETIKHVLEDGYSQEQLIKTIDDTKSDLIVAEKQKQIVGFAISSWKDIDAELESIYILSDYQGEGIGTRILHYIIKKLSSTVKNIGFGAIKGNKGAMSFYMKNGFVKKMK